MDNNRKLHFNPWLVVAIFSVILVGALLFIGSRNPLFPNTGADTPIPYKIDTGTEGSATGTNQGSGDEYGLEVGVGEGQAHLQTPVPLPVATGEPLTSQEVDDIFARLPALPVSPDEQAEFKYPVILLPPPRPGTPTGPPGGPPGGRLKPKAKGPGCSGVYIPDWGAKRAGPYPH